MITVQVLVIDGVEVAQVLEGEHDTGTVITALGKSFTLVPLISEKDFEELEGRIVLLANTVEVVLSDDPDREVLYKLSSLGFEERKAVLAPRLPQDLADSILKVGFAMYPKETLFCSTFGHEVRIPNLSEGRLRFAVHYPMYEVFDVREFFEEAFTTVMRWVERWTSSSGLKSL